MKQSIILILVTVLTISLSCGQEGSKPEDLSSTFTKLVKTYPADSSSLYRFYFKWNPAKNSSDRRKQIERMNKLLSSETQSRYNEVIRNLKPLMKNAVETNFINITETNKFVELYSAFDELSAESLFNSYLKDDENYTLVWETMKIISKAFLTTFIVLLLSFTLSAQTGETKYSLSV